MKKNVLKKNDEVKLVIVCAITLLSIIYLAGYEKGIRDIYDIV